MPKNSTQPCASFSSAGVNSVWTEEVQLPYAIRHPEFVLSKTCNTEKGPWRNPKGPVEKSILCHCGEPGRGPFFPKYSDVLHNDKFHLLAALGACDINVFGLSNTGLRINKSLTFS
jgi:hypothetical protein